MEGIKTSIDQQIDAISENENFKSIIMSLVSKGDYMYEDNLVVSYLCYSVLKHLEWDSHDTKFKIFLASMFHDISIPESRIAIENELLDDFSPEDLKEKNPDYYNHPLSSAKYIYDFKEIPPDVNAIIAQHHEKPNGKGFPRGITASTIFPLSACFIIAHEMCVYLYKNGWTQENTKKFIRDNENYFFQGSFKQPYEAFRKEFNA